MLVGREKPVPKFMERYFEGLWRLRFDTKRRFKRLAVTSFYYLSGITTSYYTLNLPPFPFHHSL